MYGWHAEAGECLKDSAPAEVGVRAAPAPLGAAGRLVGADAYAHMAAACACAAAYTHALL